MSGTTTNPEKLRVGVIGGGYIGTTVGRQFEEDPRSTVVAIADVSEPPRDEAGDTLYVGQGSRYEDYAEMLDAEELDAVLIGTPHVFHYEQTMAALDEGLHVLCDKPLTTDREKARELAERSEQEDQLLMVGYQRHLNQAFIRARERWDETNLTPRFISAEITQNWISRFEETWRTDPDLSGGGNLYDTGSHLIDAVLWTTGLKPTSVQADMKFADEENRVDERAQLVVEFEGGASASIAVYSDAPCVREHIHIWDDDGALYLEGRQWEPRQLTEIEADSTTVVPFMDNRRHESKAGSFIDCIESGKEPPATARDAFAVTALTEAAYESARTGERISIDLD
ncbi:Gfo/Idh/MocA family protein [Haladaptatus pallidirubidus]|uniref:Gfo/Idh/MocA family oxidoreductase n=1 Tax=Haladaptatus pallidirubidus TaxID=1008152 RepID=A0AAV3UKC8_9EURY|nr:Gfo/Idh/MocA family oxidoreductase [Haladaptatus pallidirubidus]